ncbi:MAG: hypothetical protein MUF27_16335 [Acidobacteria bacterium]|nr:hypothetical protein [Acidobacteriota bacterium]
MHHPLNDDDLRAAYRGAAVSAGVECPSSEDLAALAAGAIDAAAREPLLVHVARCCRCADDLRLILPARPAPGRRPAWLPLAAAAALAVALPLGTWWVSRPASPGVVYRQPAPASPLAPVAELPDGAELPRRAFVLRWKPVAGATRYDVIVADAALAPLHEVRDASANEVTVPAESLPERGVVLWRIEAIMPDGSRRASPLYRAAVR